MIITLLIAFILNEAAGQEDSEITVTKQCSYLNLILDNVLDGPTDSCHRREKALNLEPGDLGAIQ